jgi:hypothetical protein
MHGRKAKWRYSPLTTTMWCFVFPMVKMYPPDKLAASFRKTSFSRLFRLKWLK